MEHSFNGEPMPRLAGYGIWVLINSSQPYPNTNQTLLNRSREDNSYGKENKKYSHHY